MKIIFLILLCLVSLKSFSNEINDSYSQALELIKTESINPPTASYLMSEASSVAYKTYKHTLDKKAYQVSFLTLLKLYVRSKNNRQILLR